MVQALYGAVPQHGRDDDDARPSPSPWASPSLFSSPSSSVSKVLTMAPPFLSLAGTAFTPLSLDSSDEDDTCATASSSATDQSPLPIRATAPAPRRGSASQLLSPTSPEMSSRSSLSSSPANNPPSEATSPAADASFDLLPGKPATCAISTLYEERSSSTVGDGPGSLDDDTKAELPHLPGRQGPTSGLDATAPPTAADAPGSAGEPSRTRGSPTILRPKFTTRPPPLVLSDIEPSKPAIVRTTSSRGRLPLCHPAPDLNVRSGAYVGNIAQLEATAERFSMTSSIEDAIREAHQELKRSESRRSSILAANNAKSLGPDTANESGRSRQSSIVGINNAARWGGYSPNGYVMSPSHSLSGVRIPPTGKAGASGSGVAESLALVDDGFPFLSRHGTGKSSVHSTHSNRVSLPEIAESEPPMTLTQEALDEADRITAEGEEPGDDDTIRASAHQHVDVDFDFGTGLADDLGLAPDSESWANRPAQDHHTITAAEDHLSYGPSSQPTIANQIDFSPYRQGHTVSHARPTTSGSGATYEQAQNAFGDFDGVHCDPDNVDFPEMRQLDMPKEHQHMSKPLPPSVPQRTSYVDPNTKQQMLYYPARVPAMLNLPPKLSKNPKATTERNQRRSKILSAMPQAARDSRVWLPDPLEGDLGSPLMESEEQPQPYDRSLEATQTAEGSEPQQSPELPADQASPSTDQPAEAESPRQFRRPPRLTDVNKRKSRMSTMDLPPQLRASVFFDLPSTSPQIEVKNGSAMATLDSILDASATAPVSAFTDHVYAGKLGSEVYGVIKKRPKKKNAAEDLQLPASTAVAPDTKKRSSFLSLIGHTRKNSEPVNAADRRSMLGADGVVDEVHIAPREDGDALSPGLSEGDAALAPDKDEEESAEEEEDEDEDEDNVYLGAPTTLLAELQLRKQQQKLRTRPAHKAFPNGLHSTLLELDAVAEVERKARKGKKINLAWEDPTLKPDAQDEDEDEDVPLGMLYAARAAGHNDISAVAAELNRPLGLMERKALEDSEPLSRRRDRLQGREPVASMYLGAGLGAHGPNKRQSMMTLTPTIAALNNAGAISSGQQNGPSPQQQQQEEPEEEVESETLGERMRRLKAKEASELPRARPVSVAFTAELLTQFRDPQEDAKENDKGKAISRGKENDPPEEEETLGQRRRLW